MRKKLLSGIPVLVILLVMTSFQQSKIVNGKKVPEIVKQKIEEDLRIYYAERLKVCKLEALLKAEDYVDSIIVNRINLNIMNGTVFPERPVRPPSPGPVQLDDTTLIRPILR